MRRITTLSFAVLLVMSGAVGLDAQRGVARKPTYAAATILKTATAAGTAPFFSICGSAARPIEVQALTVSGTVGTAAVYGDVVVIKTSTASSGGTATALTQTRLDSANRAGSATRVNFYTVLPTAGTAAGAIAARSAVFPITGTLAAEQALIVFDWRQREGGELQPPTLRGTGECLEASFGTTTTNAPTLAVEVLWTEQ